MVEILFNKLLDRVQGSVDDLMSDRYFYNYIYENIAKRINEMYTNNPELTSEEVEKILYDEINEFRRNQSKVSINRYVIRHLIQEELRRNPRDIKALYTELADEVDEKYIKKVQASGYFNEVGDYEHSKKTYIKNAISLLRITKRKIILEFCEIPDEGARLLEKEFSELTEEELQQISSDTISVFGKKSANVDIDLTEINEEKFNEFKSRMSAIIDETTANMEYVANLGTNQRKRIMKELRVTIDDLEKKVPFFKIPLEARKYENPEIRKKVAEMHQLEYWIKNVGIDFQTQIKDCCISEILNNIAFLDGYGLLDEKIIQRKKFFDNLPERAQLDGEIANTIREIPYTREEILEIFSEESLKKKSLKQLLSLNAEWSNNAAKAMADVNNVVFLTSQLDLFEDIRNNKNMAIYSPDNNAVNDKVDDTVLRATFEKLRILQILSYRLKDAQYKNNRELKKLVKSDTSKYYADYKKYFSSRIPGAPNQVLQDFMKYKPGADIKANLYMRKDENMLALVSIFEQGLLTEDVNWGLVLDEREPDVVDEKSLLVNFDIPELIMPIRLHIPRKILKEHLAEVHKTHVIKIYEGNNDFIIKGRQTPSYGAYPATSRFKRLIEKLKNIVTEDMVIYDFIMHTNYFLNQEQYPKSMKKAGEKNKKGKIRYTKIKRFVNVETGKIMDLKEAVQEVELGIAEPNISDNTMDSPNSVSPSPVAATDNSKKIVNQRNPANNDDPSDPGGDDGNR